MTEEKQFPQSRAARRAKGQPDKHAASRLTELAAKHKQLRGGSHVPGRGTKGR